MKPYLLPPAVWLTLLILPAIGQEGEPAAGPFRISAVREHQVTVAASRAQYQIDMSGTVDMDNSMTRSYGGFDVAFQPNLSLQISNTGDVPVVNPRVVTNGKRKWWSLDELLDEMLAGAADDQEKALLIWDFVRRHRHHDAPLFGGDELHDPVKFLCIYGGGLCDDSGNVGCSLLFHAGLNKQKFDADPKTRAMHGHVMCEARLGGGYQFLDIDQNAFYLDRENERLLSGDELARDHDLVKREHAYGPIFRDWDVGARAASVLGADDEAGFRAVAGHRIEITLRPGETIVYRWDNRGKFATDGPERRTFWSNSLLGYEPRLDGQHYQDAAASAKDIAPDPAADGDGRLAGQSPDAHLVYQITSPFVICGGRVSARLLGRHPQDRFEVALSLDEKTWEPVWERTGEGAADCRVDLDEPLGVGQAPPRYTYFVRLSLASAEPGSACLAGLRLETDVMTSPHFLPRLSLGRNQVVYTDETPGEHEVSITYRWRESDNITPPRPPAEPLFPADESLVRQSTFDFRWQDVPEARRYHLLVSRYADMKLPYRTAFDVVVSRARHGSPWTGMFSPDTDYYWRVRAQNGHGVWGDWSQVWQFRWDGPRVPVDLGDRIEPGGEITIFWKPNPRGPRPVAYEVYGSDERGFSVSKEPYEVLGLGERPSNFLTRTTGTEITVVSAAATHASHNRCYYRVVAVDQRGTSSGPSDYVELPHPYLYSQPPQTAVPGKPYRYQLETLRSLGDLQYRYTTPNQGFWEREEYRYELIEGPGWLELDRESGLLSGTPTGAGTVEVVVEATRHFPHEVKPSDQRGAVFQKSAARFQASQRQRFEIRIEPSTGPILEQCPERP